MNEFIEYALKTGAGLALFFASYWFLLRRDTFFRLNRCYLLSALAVSFLLAAVDFSPWTARLFPFLSAVPERMSLGPGIPLSPPSWNLQDLAAVLYLAGAAFLLIRLLACLVRLMLLIRRAGVRRQGGARLVISEGVDAPFSFFRFVFLSPAHLEDRNCRRIIAHELVHARQLHSLDLLLVELAIALQWFNPIVWAYRRALKETHEFLADEEVLAMGFSRAGYQMLIYEQLLGASLFEFANNFNDSQIKRRLEMMTKAKSMGHGKLKVLAGLPLMFLLAVAFGAAGDPGPTAADDAYFVPASGVQQPQEKEKQNQALEKKEKKEMLVKKGDGEAALAKEELLKRRSEIDAKLADKSLSAKDREMLLKKKDKIEAELNANGGNGKAAAPPPKTEDLLKMRSEIDAKLGDSSLSEKDREMLLKKKQTIETLLQQQKKQKSPPPQ